MIPFGSPWPALAEGVHLSPVTQGFPKTMEHSLCDSHKDLWDVSHVPGSEPVQGHSVSNRGMAAALREPTD